ncbi:hypothetical protein [Kocuria sp.]|uniref:hypothetical protein n=1 Tax=Kocuria sp. TaxID=1871328 RepID=UPI0026E09781|nr:hypothetical protein [Kocuria sp.]MDO5619387.1 hypothetical protein [Kocuria sp.]
MNTWQPFTPPASIHDYGDRGPWAQRGRRVTEPVSGSTHVLLPLPAGGGAITEWNDVVATLAAADDACLAPPRAVVDDDESAWLLYDDLPQRSFAALIGQEGGAVQAQVLPVMAQALRAVGVLHDHGLTLRRLSLRDVISHDGTPEQWRLLLSPDSGVRRFTPGAQDQEVQGDLIMVAAAAATVLTGRRPVAGRVRAPLRSVCPTLPGEALDALDELLDHLPASGQAVTVPNGVGANPPGEQARHLAETLEGRGQVQPNDGDFPGQEEADTESLELMDSEGLTQPQSQSQVQSSAQVQAQRDDDAGSGSAQRVLAVLRGEAHESEAHEAGWDRGQRRSADGQADARGHGSRLNQTGSEAARGGRRHAGAESTALTGRAAGGRPWGATEWEDTAARRRPGLVLVLAAALVVSGGATAVWTLWPESRTDADLQVAQNQQDGGVTESSAGETNVAAPPAGTSSPDSNSPEAALGELIAARVQAFRDDDPEALSAIYTQGSPALEADRRTLETVEADPAQGDHAFSELTMQLQDTPQVVESTDTQARLMATVSAAGVAEGQPAEQRAEFTLVLTDQGWRLETVQPR